MELYVFDFDRTLISTQRVLERVNPALPPEAREACERMAGQGKTTDVMEIANQYAVPAADLEAALDSGILYDDVAPWMRANESNPNMQMMVMTSGGDDWQRMKLAAVDDVIPARRVIVAEVVNKGEVLASELVLDSDGVQWPAQFGATVFRAFTLVDDKFACLRPLIPLPESKIQLYNIIRNDAKEQNVPENGRIVTIRSLSEIRIPE